MTITEAERQRLLGEAEQAKVSYPRFQRSGLVASLLGMLAGLGMLVLVSATLAAGAILLALEFDLTRPVDGVREMSLVGVGIAAVVLLVSTLTGGFVAGRTARYGGAAIGLGSSLWLALVLLLFTGLTLLIGTLSATFDGFGLVDRLALVATDNLATAAAITGGGLIILGLLGGLLGGRLGETKEQDSRMIVDIRDIEATKGAKAEDTETEAQETERDTGKQEEPVKQEEPTRAGQHEANSREPVYSQNQPPPPLGF